VKPNPTPGELLDSEKYELIDEVEYLNLKSFILAEIGRKSGLILLYGILQVFAVAVLLGMLGAFGYGFFTEGVHKNEMLATGITLLFSFTLLIPVHELLHAAAFLALGKKDIGFGGIWKKFVFYAEANRQVLNRKEMTIVALTPFMTVFIAGLAIFLFSESHLFSLSGLVVVLIHFMFCGGDFAIISYFNRHRNDEVFTFDDRKGKKSYYFRKRPLLFQ
jgi:hypothetical protein